MTDKEDPLFARISRAASKLNAAADRATTYIKSVEKRLADAGVGVEVWGPVLDSNSRSRPNPESVEVLDEPVWEQIFSETTLGYGKAGHRRGFVVSYDETDQVGNSTETARRLLLETDRETRIAAVVHIPKLLEGIAEEIEKTAEKVDQTLGTDSTIAQLKETAESGDKDALKALRVLRELSGKSDDELLAIENEPSK